MSEKEKDSDEVLEARVQKEALAALLNSPGWSILARVWQEQADRRTNQVVFHPLGDPEGCKTALEQEYLKGEIAAFRLCLKMPHHLLEMAQEELDSTQAENEDDGQDTCVTSP